MILFIEKTWFLWWVFAACAALRWFHLLSVRGKTENSDAFTEAEEADVSDRVLQKAYKISLPEMDQHSERLMTPRIGEVAGG